MGNTTVEIIKEMRKMLDDKSRWVKGKYYADNRGREIDRDYAQRYCLVGAMNIAANKTLPSAMSWSERNEVHARVRRCIERIIRRSRPRTFQAETFNDSRRTKYEDVIDVLDDAIREGCEFREV